MKEYEDLFIAIWGQAVKDDIDEVVRKCYNNAINNAYKYYLKNTETPLELRDKKFKTFKKDLRDYCKLRVKDIEGRIKELILKESDEWPCNQRYKLRDEEYNQTLTEIMQDTEEFAIVRIKARMRYLV